MTLNIARTSGTQANASAVRQLNEYIRTSFRGLLHRDRLLSQGSLETNNIIDGARLTVLPNVETGIMSQKPDIHSVMKALENLSDSQVNDFLTGKSPLTLAWRFEDHMMFVQLQLSTMVPGATRLRRTSTVAPPRPSSASLVPSSPSASSVLSSPSASSVQSSPSASSVPSSPSASSMPSSPSASSMMSTSSASSSSSPSTSSASSSSSPPPMLPRSVSLAASERTTSPASSIPTLDMKALEQASRNLTHRLKRLSNTPEGPKETATPPQPAGAIIESLKAHGKGVYSGTFSGTLNPSLTDKKGRPKRSIATVIHILNDLLGAHPTAKVQPQRLHGFTQELNRQRMSPSGLHGKPAAAAGRFAERCISRNAATDDRAKLRQENMHLKGKMEQLQLMMEERRVKRQMRRDARAPHPYTVHSKASMEPKEDAASDVMDVDSEKESVEPCPVV
ncbi:PREDICTED: midnolin-like [Priapulus caudatus]|uniref:Midnolin-like n=1 Tax=Priapulus caudatus TaxID=37621 RepID=A0ABM1E0M3_PRICU|nr:PREDICTED: midnolin-like [Priapulus caudatus]